MKKFISVGLLLTVTVGVAAADDRDREWRERTGLPTALQQGANRLQPAQVPGLVLWLEAAQGVTTNAAGRVSAWADRSGHTNTLVQDSLELQPVVQPHLVNGRPAVRFAGTPGFGQALMRDRLTTGPDGITILALVRQNAAEGYTSLLTFGSDSGVQGAKLSGADALVDNEYSANIPGRAINGTGFRICGLTADRRQGLSKLFHDGQRVGQLRKPFALATAGPFILGTLRPGRQSIAAGFNGDIAELLVFNRPLADDERRQMEVYLQDKYALGGDRMPYVTPLASRLPFAYYPGYGELEVAIDADAFFAKAGQPLPATMPGATEVRVYPQGADKAVAEGRVPLDAQGRGQAIVKLPELADGEYRVEYRIGAVAVPASQTFKRQHFAFEGCAFGKEHKVYPPFTPVKVDGNRVAVVDRTYTVNALGLFDSVKSKERELLAAPMQLVVETADGKRVEWKGGGWFDSGVKGRVAHPDLAVFKTEAKGSGFRVQSSVEVEEDGCAKVALTLNPEPRTLAPISRAWLEIAVKETEAPLFHYVGGNGTMRHHYAGKTPRGGRIVWAIEEDCQSWTPMAYRVEKGPDDGEIWNSGRILPMGRPLGSGSWFQDKFVSYVWLGAEERGLAWFADNLHEGVPGDVPAQSVVRQGDRILLRVNLIAEPTVLDQSRHFTFGLQASPTKPLRADWRRHDVPAGGGCTVVCIGGYYCNSKYPDGRDFGIVDKVIEEGRTGKIDEAYWKQKDANRVWKDEKVFGNQDWVQACHWGRANGEGRLGMYFEEHVFHPRMEEWAIFRDEWSTVEFERFTFPNWSNAPGRNYWDCGNARPVAPSLVDFCLYYGNEYMRRGISLYFDNAYPTTTANPRINGFAGPDTTIWGYRAYYKRIWKRMQELYLTGVVDKPLDFTGHITNTQVLPMNTWFTATLDLEQPYRVDRSRAPRTVAAGDASWMSKGDGYRLPFPPDYTRAMTLGRTVGVIPHIMFPLPNWGDYRDAALLKTLTEANWNSDAGMQLVHEIARPWRAPGWQRSPEGGYRGARLTDYVAWFGYGQSNVVVHNYWEEKPFVTVSDPEVKWLALEKKDSGFRVQDLVRKDTGSTPTPEPRTLNPEPISGLLLLQSYKEEPVTVSVRYPGGAAMMDFFTRELFTADARGAVAIPVAGVYGTRLLAVAGKRADLPVVRPAGSLAFDDFELGLSSALTQSGAGMSVAEAEQEPGNHVLRIPPGHPSTEVLRSHGTLETGDYTLGFRFRLANLPSGAGQGGVLSLGYREAGGRRFFLGLGLSMSKDAPGRWTVEHPRLVKDGGDGEGYQTVLASRAVATPVDTAWHRLSVRVQGKRHQVLLDDVLVFEGEDDRNLTGGFSIAPGWGWDLPIKAVEIDDLLVTAPRSE